MPISRFLSDLDQLIADFKADGPTSAATYDELRLAAARLNEISRQLAIAYRKIEPVIAMAEMEAMHDQRESIDAAERAVNDRFLVHEACLTGHQRIDEDHRELFALSNRVFALACATHVTSTDVLNLLNDFLAHCREHFAYEESLMAKFGFPVADKHKVSHDRMIEYIEEMRTLTPTNPMVVAIKMDKFIGSWFTWHMQRDDMALAEHIKANSRD
jgi:hemerythrin